MEIQAAIQVDDIRSVIYTFVRKAFYIDHNCFRYCFFYIFYYYYHSDYRHS